MQNHIVDLWNAYQGSSRKDSPPLGIGPEHFFEGLDCLSLVSEQSFEDFFLAKLAQSDTGGELGFKNVLEWLTVTTSNTPSSAANIRDVTTHDAVPFPIFVDRLRQVIWNAIAGVLKTHAAEASVPKMGTILYFTEGLTYCYVISYHLHYERPVIHILDRIKKPTGIFELDNISTLRNHRSRNHAKNYLTSGHKLVMQRGVLTHVDRRLDKNVFGPTIDTVILADILGQLDISRRSAVRSFLEIGSGSGHISSSVAALFRQVGFFSTIDINEFANACTVRNLRATVRSFHKRPLDKFVHHYSIVGEFKENPFSSTFDLVVSNPPYVADGRKWGESFKERFSEAVSGTELIRDLYKALPGLLSKDGRMLLMLSSVSEDFGLEYLPDGFRASPALASKTSEIEVPFDVEEVLDQDDWVEVLVKGGALKEGKGNTFTHRLRPQWIERIP